VGRPQHIPWGGRQARCQVHRACCRLRRRDPRHTKGDLLSQEVKQQRRALQLAWSAACALLALVSAAGWGWNTALVNERAAVEQRNRAVAAGRDATEQKNEAQTQRDRAVRNFGIAKDAADRVVFRIAQDLRAVQGMRVESLRRILDAAQSLMDEFAKTSRDWANSALASSKLVDATAARGRATPQIPEGCRQRMVGGR
jgi:hypothetical protein